MQNSASEICDGSSPGVFGHTPVQSVSAASDRVQYDGHHYDVQIIMLNSFVGGVLV